MKIKQNKHQLILIAILFLALGLRTAHWLDVRGDPFFAQLIMDSQEYDRWAVEIAAGDWIGHQVFFQAPLYPYLLAVLYLFFGHNLDIVYMAQILLALAGIYALFRTGKILGGDRLGLFAAALAAFYSIFIFYDVQILKESTAVSLVSFLLWILLKARKKGRYNLWLAAGILSGLLSLLRENMLLVFPFLILLVYKRGERKKTMLLNASGIVLGLMLILGPVALRNGIVGGVFAPTTFQGGVNFYIGNNPRADGSYKSIVPGKQIPRYERNEPIRIAEQETGKVLSPGEVSSFWLNKALSWAVHKPFDYLRLQGKKFLMFWSWYEWPDAVDYYYVRRTSKVLGFPLLQFGSIFLLALIGLFAIRRNTGVFLVPAVFLAAWMVSTIIFFLFSRYRLPALPALMIFAAAALNAGVVQWKTSKAVLRCVLGLGLVTILAAPYFFSFTPRMDIVHYNLALVYDGLGNVPKAKENYLAALAVNPDDFLSCINLGNLAVRGNNWTAALSWYKKAVAIEPDSDGAHSNLGGAYVALGDLEKGESHIDRALNLNPSNVLALHNKSILLANKGRYKDAQALNTKVLALSPNWPPALHFRSRLSQFLKRH